VLHCFVMKESTRATGWALWIAGLLAFSCGDSEQTGAGGSAGAGGATGTTTGTTTGVTGTTTGATGTTTGTGGSQGGAGGGGADAGQCPGGACQAGQVCVAYRTVGGAVFEPDDAGACPPGRHAEPFGTGRSACVADWAYRCVELRGCTMMKVSCSCGQTSCPQNYTACADPAPNDMWLDPAAQLTCSQLAP
jgi:hypothetical protein